MTPYQQTENKAGVGVRRRLCVMMYESLLLFGVVFIAGYLFDALTQSKHGLMLRDARQLWLFLIFGVYFCGFWMNGGQTLAMKTWHVCLLNQAGCKPSWQKLILRYFFSLSWFVPGLFLAWLLSLWLGLPPLGFFLGLLLNWCVMFFLIHRDVSKQVFYDRWLGLRLVLVK
jgi:hypothetical protein